MYFQETLNFPRILDTNSVNILDQHQQTENVAGVAWEHWNSHHIHSNRNWAFYLRIKLCFIDKISSTG